MKIVVAPDSFKESLSSLRVAQALASGIRHAFPHADLLCIPLADGGEGSLEALYHALDLDSIEVDVEDPLGKLRRTCYAWDHRSQCAFIEAAQIIGLPFVKAEERKPLQSSSYGVGQCIAHALEKGCRKMILFLGGTATCDAGIGALGALGACFYDSQGKEVKPHISNLDKIYRVDTASLYSRFREVEILFAADVDNVLLGEQGMTLYAPQKGASFEESAWLERAVQNYCERVKESGGKSSENEKGSGAAGGLAYSLAAFSNGSFQPGFDVIADSLALEKLLHGASLLFTGEGEINHQSIHGKTPVAAARLAKKQNIPVIAIAGTLGKGHELVLEQGIDALFSIASGPLSLEECIGNAELLLCSIGRHVATTFKRGIQIHET